MKKFFFINLVLISILFIKKTEAKLLSKECKTINQCIETVSKLTGKQYLYTKDLKGEVKGSKNLAFDKSNADMILSEILNQNGYTRVLLEDGKTYQVLNARDIRYNPVPRVESSYDKAPDLPNTSDYYMMSYNVRFRQHSTEMTRSLRPFMSRYGRIIDIKNKGGLLVQDTAKNLKRIYGIIREMDLEPTRALKRRYMAKEERRQQIALEKAKNCAK